jgi:hypothetical protein
MTATHKSRWKRIRDRCHIAEARVAELEAERAEMIREIRAVFGDLIDGEWALFAGEHPGRMSPWHITQARALIGIQGRWPELFDPRAPSPTAAIAARASPPMLC